MYFVYIIKSQTFSNKIYIGKTRNLKKRLANHNCGTTSHTAKYRPWELVMYLAFRNEINAIEFEKYLKSHSGRTFAVTKIIVNILLPGEAGISLKDFAKKSAKE